MNHTEADFITHLIKTRAMVDLLNVNDAINASEHNPDVTKTQFISVNGHLPEILLLGLITNDPLPRLTTLGVGTLLRYTGCAGVSDTAKACADIFYKEIPHKLRCYLAMSVYGQYTFTGTDASAEIDERCAMDNLRVPFQLCHLTYSDFHQICHQWVVENENTTIGSQMLVASPTSRLLRKVSYYLNPISNPDRVRMYSFKYANRLNPTYVTIATCERHARLNVVNEMMGKTVADANVTHQSYYDWLQRHFTMTISELDAVITNVDIPEYSMGDQDG